MSKKCGALTGEVASRLESLLENLELVNKQLKQGVSCSAPSSICLEEFNKSLLAHSSSISTECTKLSVLFSNPPCPSAEEYGVLCSKLENFSLSFISLYSRCNHDWGETFVSEVHEVVKNIINSILVFAKLLISEGCLSNSRQRLQGTGSVWEVCDSVKTMSKDNRSAVLRVCFTQLQLLRDACEEIDELLSNNGVVNGCSFDDGSLNGDGDETPDEEESSVEGWSPSDRPLCQVAAELVKFAAKIGERMCNCVVKGNVGASESVLSMDQSAFYIMKISPLVDELVNCMDAPLIKKELQDNFTVLHAMLQEISEKLSDTSCYKGTVDWPTKELQKALLDLSEAFRNPKTL